MNKDIEAFIKGKFFKERLTEVAGIAKQIEEDRYGVLKLYRANWRTNATIIMEQDYLTSTFGVGDVYDKIPGEDEELDSIAFMHKGHIFMSELRHHMILNLELEMHEAKLAGLVSLVDRIDEIATLKLPIETVEFSRAKQCPIITIPYSIFKSTFQHEGWETSEDGKVITAPWAGSIIQADL